MPHVSQGEATFCINGYRLPEPVGARKNRSSRETLATINGEKTNKFGTCCSFLKDRKSVV